jgi:two-component system, cell cycle response regulator
VNREARDPYAGTADELRERLRALTEEVQRNELLLRKTQDREVELLLAHSLGELFDRVVSGLRTAYGLDRVTLSLFDPQHELRHLSANENLSSDVIEDVRFIDSVSPLARRLAQFDRPWLGAYDPDEHELLISPGFRQGSIALIPLPRDNQAIGIMAFGSREPRRFTSNLAADFLAHLGKVVAISLENAVNRARLVRSGVTDFLTGWHNRRYFHTRMREELARAERTGKALACMMIDVDNFKEINDRFGHLAGDEALKEVARRAEAEIRAGDTGARFGGDEFAILLAGAESSHAVKLAERIHQSVGATPIRVHGGAHVTVTLSIGLASARPKPQPRAHDHKVLAERLIAEADAALYRAKSAGRNRVEVAANPIG